MRSEHGLSSIAPSAAYPWVPGTVRPGSGGHFVLAGGVASTRRTARKLTATTVGIMAGQSRPSQPPIRGGFPAAQLAQISTSMATAGGWKSLRSASVTGPDRPYFSGSRRARKLSPSRPPQKMFPISDRLYYRPTPCRDCESLRARLEPEEQGLSGLLTDADLSDFQPPAVTIDVEI